MSDETKNVMLEKIQEAIDVELNDLKEWGYSAKETLAKIEALTGLYRKVSKGY